jgi:predicted O-linked N-acetylglucosamine transferase (SPINDLY family)
VYLPSDLLADVVKRYATWVQHAVAPVAATWAAQAKPPPTRPTSKGRLVLAYMSADFSEHAVGQLLRSVPALHDRLRFKVSVWWRSFPVYSPAWRPSSPSSAAYTAVV